MCSTILNTREHESLNHLTPPDVYAEREGEIPTAQEKIKRLTLLRGKGYNHGLPVKNESILLPARYEKVFFPFQGGFSVARQYSFLNMCGGVIMRSSSIALPTAGDFWVFKCLVVALIAAIVFTSAPALLFHKNVEMPPAYELKAEHPFSDTSTLTIPEHEGERSHGAKLTPRLVGSILLYLVTGLSWHPYLPATIFGLLFLLSGIRIGYQITGDRLIGLFLGLTFSGLYASSACFSINWDPKPFDGIAIGLLGLTMISMRRKWVLFVLAFLSCWTDERAIISLVVIAAFAFTWSALSARKRASSCATIACAILLYLISRILISYLLNWGSPDLGMIGIGARLGLLFSPLAFWTCFEGGWITIIIAAWILFTQRDHLRLSLLLGSVALTTLACLLVLDISRVTCFVFPLIPFSYSLLYKNNLSLREFRILAGSGAAISLLAPNFEIVAGVAVRWLPPLLPALLSMK